MIKKFISYYKPHRKLFALDLLAAVVLALIDLIFPMISRTVINDLIPEGRMDMILYLSLGAFALYVVRLGCNYFISYWGHVMGSRMEHDMRKDLFEHIQTLSFSYFDNTKTGQIMSRLVGDLNTISELAHHGPEDLFISGLMIIGSFFILIRIHVMLTLVVFLVVLFVIIYSTFSRKNMLTAFRSVRTRNAEINSRIENSISGIRLAKSFANEPFEIDKFSVCNAELRESKNNAFRAMGIFSSVNGFLTDQLNLVVISLGGYFVYIGAINYGDLVAYLLYTSFFTRPIRRLIQFTQQFQQGMAGFERFYEILNLEPEIKETEGAKDLKDVKGNIRFANVSFRYEKDHELVLEDFSIEFPEGKTVALVGPSGVGKTTISQLIPRFYDAESGQITIDGLDVKDTTFKSLRENIGVVQQDVTIFYGSIKDNIEYGRPGASDEEIYAAAKSANIHDFILNLEDGYDTMVGERGIKLSGGQKQRVAIARVFLKNPPVLILDEATSSLDNENELAIQESIEKLAVNRTTIIIAHRLSTIMKSDEIIVLTDLGIKERGTHLELLDAEGLYARLFNAQFKGFIPDKIVN